MSFFLQRKFVRQHCTFASVVRAFWLLLCCRRTLGKLLISAMFVDVERNCRLRCLLLFLLSVLFSHGLSLAQWHRLSTATNTWLGHRKEKRRRAICFIFGPNRPFQSPHFPGYKPCPTACSIPMSSEYDKTENGAPTNLTVLVS